MFFAMAVPSILVAVMADRVDEKSLTEPGIRRCSDIDLKYVLLAMPEPV